MSSERERLAYRLGRDADFIEGAQNTHVSQYGKRDEGMDLRIADLRRAATLLQEDAGGRRIDGSGYFCGRMKDEFAFYPNAESGADYEHRATLIVYAHQPTDKE